MKHIDVHAHVGTPAADRLLTDHPGLVAQREAESQSQGATTIAYNLAQIQSLGPELTKVELRLAAMDQGGIDIQTVTATPIARPWMDEGLAERYIAAVNAEVLAHCKQAPDRLVPVASVSLHHPELAAAQLRETVTEFGFYAAQISTAAAPGVELDDPTLDVFWQTAVELDVPVLIHPWGCSLGERLNVGYLFNHVGNPTETALALSRLIFGGTLDRHPKLRLWAAHAGGWLPSYSGRADHAWHARSDARTCAHPPSSYLRRMWFDQLVYGAAELRFLADRVGPAQITLATDYPFDMGITHPVAQVEQAFPDLATRTAICQDSAVALFGTRLEQFIAERSSL